MIYAYIQRTKSKQIIGISRAKELFNPIIILQSEASLNCLCFFIKIYWFIQIRSEVVPVIPARHYKILNKIHCLVLLSLPIVSAYYLLFTYLHFIYLISNSDTFFNRINNPERKVSVLERFYCTYFLLPQRKLTI